MEINLITGLCIGRLYIMAVQIPDGGVGYMTHKEMPEKLYPGSIFLVLYVQVRNKCESTYEAVCESAVTYSSVYLLIPCMLYMTVTNNEVLLCGDLNNGNYILSIVIGLQIVG